MLCFFVVVFCCVLLCSASLAGASRLSLVYKQLLQERKDRKDAAAAVSAVIPLLPTALFRTIHNSMHYAYVYDARNAYTVFNVYIVCTVHTACCILYTVYFVLYTLAHAYSNMAD